MNAQLPVRQDPHRPNWTDAQLALIKETICRPLSARLFDQFMEAAIRLRLDPLKKQITPIVFNRRIKNAETKQWENVPQLTIITTIDGYRAIAGRSGAYRADDKPPRFDIREELIDKAVNPLGIEKVEVSVYAYSHGQWFEAVAEAYWDEYAPVVEGGTWRQNETGDSEFVSNGTRQLDPKMEQWGKRPRGQLAKCAEALALRKAFPEDLSGTHVEEEFDRAKVIDADYVDLTASQRVEKAQTDKRIAAVNADRTILFSFKLNGDIEPTPVGTIADRCMAFLAEHGGDVQVLIDFRERNRHALREFWARAPNDGLAVKKAFEQAIDSGQKSKVQTDAILAELRNDRVVYSPATLDAFAERAEGRIKGATKADLERLNKAIAERHAVLAERETEPAAV